MGRHAQRDDAPHPARPRWTERILLALAVLAATCLGVVWAGGGWRTGLVIGAGAAVVVVGAMALSTTMPAPPGEPDE